MQILVARGIFAVLSGFLPRLVVLLPCFRLQIEPPPENPTFPFMKMSFRSLLFLPLVTLCVCAAGAADESAVIEKFRDATPLEWSMRMADSELKRYGDALN